MRGNQKLLALFAIAASASLLAVQAAVAQDNPTANVSPVTEEMLLNPPEGDWLSRGPTATATSAKSAPSN